MIGKRLKTKIICLSVWLFMFYSCTNEKSTSALDKNLCPLPLDTVALKLKPLEEYSGNFNGYIYIMNSECSECIGSFISFANNLDKSGYRDSVLAIIAPATRPIVNHYIKKM